MTFSGPSNIYAAQNSQCLPPWGRKWINGVEVLLFHTPCQCMSFNQTNQTTHCLHQRNNHSWWNFCSQQLVKKRPVTILKSLGNVSLATLYMLNAWKHKIKCQDLQCGVWSKGDQGINISVHPPIVRKSFLQKDMSSSLRRTWFRQRKGSGWEKKGHLGRTTADIRHRPGRQGDQGFSRII